MLANPNLRVSMIAGRFGVSVPKPSTAMSHRRGLNRDQVRKITTSFSRRDGQYLLRQAVNSRP